MNVAIAPAPILARCVLNTKIDPLFARGIEIVGGFLSGEPRSRSVPCDDAAGGGERDTLDDLFSSMIRILFMKFPVECNVNCPSPLLDCTE